MSTFKRIPYGDLRDQFGDLRLPEGEGPFPVAIVIHGGYWRAKLNLEHMNPLADALTAQGIATWNIEFRRLGQEGGGWPGTFLDCSKAVDYVRTMAGDYPLDLDRVITVGHSAGGHLAVWSAARHNLPSDSLLRTGEEPLKLAGVVDIAGVCDLSLMHQVHRVREPIMGINDNPTRELMGGSPAEKPVQYAEGSPSALLPIGVPMLIFHGALDINVPVGMSEHFAQIARAAGDEVIYLTRVETEHFQWIDPQTTACQEVIQATLRLLRQDERYTIGANKTQ